MGAELMTAPAATVELYCWAAGGHTPTRWATLRAATASVQLANVVRTGMATGGGPVETTTPMVEPCLAVTGLPPDRAVGCWRRMRPVPTVMLEAWPVVRTVNLSALTAWSAWATVLPTSDRHRVAGGEQLGLDGQRQPAGQEGQHAPPRWR